MNAIKHQKAVGLVFVLESLVIIVALLYVTVVPFRVHVSGRVADVIPNDHGFGIVIDKGERGINTKTYWLTGGDFQGDIAFVNWRGHLAEFEYYGTILFPRGACPFYAQLIRIAVVSGGGTY